MKYLVILLAVAAVSTTLAYADPPEVAYGPPMSPLSWQTDLATKPSTSAFAPPPHVLGVPAQPTAVTRVLFEDQRPYGETGHNSAWIVRYELVPIHGPGNCTAAVTLSLVFDPGTSGLLCAFTDPAPHWARSNAEPMDIEGNMKQDWSMGPGRYEDLRSTVIDVLAALWKNYDADPSKRGQIILRPRSVGKKFLKLNPEGNVVPQDPPENVWIVELLGAFVMQRTYSGRNEIFTNRVVMLRDGDCDFAGGMILH